MNDNQQLICITLLLITVAILAFALWGIGAVRWVALWIGEKLADLGGGGPR